MPPRHRRGSQRPRPRRHRSRNRPAPQAPRPKVAPAAQSADAGAGMIDDLEAVKSLVKKLGAEQVRRIVGLFED